MKPDRERLLAALRLALHEGTGEPESRAAWLGAWRLLRAWGADLGTFQRLVGAESNHSSIPPLPPGWHVSMPFGKFKGRPLGYIAQLEPDYLCWLLEHCDLKRGLRAAVQSVMDHLEHATR